MSVWVIGSVAYVALLLFAWALARVASSPESVDHRVDTAIETSG